MKKLDQTDVKIPREFQYPTMGDPTKVISHKKVAVNLSGEDKPIIEKYYADIIDNVLIHAMDGVIDSDSSEAIIVVNILTLIQDTVREVDKKFSYINLYSDPILSKIVSNMTNSIGIIIENIKSWESNKDTLIMDVNGIMSILNCDLNSDKAKKVRDFIEYFHYKFDIE